MKAEQIFPSILIILDLLAAFVYASQGNYRMGIYWISAATLTATITF